MKILLVAPYLPWPLDAGGKYAQFTMIEHLRRGHELTLVCCQGEDGGEAAATLRARWPDVRLRCVSPAPRTRSQRTTTAFFDRVWRFKAWVAQRSPSLLGSLRRTARAAGWEGPGTGGNALAEMGSPDLALVAAVREEAGRGGYDLVQLDFVECLELIHVLPTDVPRVFVHHQLHWVFNERLLGERLETDPALRRPFEELKAREIRLLNGFDAVLALSEVDARLLRRELDGPAVHASPFGIGEPVRVPAEGAGRETSGEFDGTVLYVGSEYHYPNLDAVNWFLEEVWGTLAATDPRLRFQVVGQWAEETRQRVRQHPRADCLGFVPELEPFLRRAIVVVPVRIGSGVRTKVLQAMMEGAPVVSTSVGCEGIPVEDGRELLVRDDPRGFAEAVLTLAGDGALRRRLGDHARRLAVEKFSVRAAGTIREEAYARVLAGWRAGRRDGEGAGAIPVRGSVGAGIGDAAVSL